MRRDRIGDRVAQNAGAEVWRDTTPCAMLLDQPAKRQSAAAQAEPVTALRHPDEPIDHDAWCERDPEDAQCLS